jgi:hypothetical protein
MLTTYAVDRQTAALLERAASLRAEFAAVVECSRVLLATGRERRLSSSYPQLRTIGGGSDVALIAAVLTNARLCLECIARKIGIAEAEANALLTELARTIRLTLGPPRCDSCLQHRTTFSVTRDGQPTG